MYKRNYSDIAVYLNIVNYGGEFVKNSKSSYNEFGNITQPSHDRKHFATTSLVMGIISIALFFLVYVSVVCAIISIVLGIFSLKSSKRKHAIYGIICSLVGIFVSIAIFVFLIYMALSNGL